MPNTQVFGSQEFPGNICTGLGQRLGSRRRARP